ncbi:MAG: response regulator transcription factor [Pedobacter sp.]|nr:MAG: response regulator transcription factor [Pedobacter sp.]
MDIKVALFEDNKLIREALHELIECSPGLRCCGTFANANNLEHDLTLCKPHVVLMDIEMPGISGIDATRIITAMFPEIKVLIQTVFDDNDKIFDALCTGASGYILKSDSPDKQIEALKAVYNGGSSMSPGVARKVMNFFVQKNVMLAPPEPTDYNLSQTEKEILSLILNGHDFRSIAEKRFISYETVRTHVKHIYKKLHVASKAEVILKARQQGIR